MTTSWKGWSRALRVALVAGALSLCAAGAWAHGGHETIPEEEAVRRARAVQELLVRRGRLGPEWAGAGVEAAELRMVDGVERWVVVFRNPDAPPGRDRLHVFLHYDGQVLGANFSGETK